MPLQYNYIAAEQRLDIVFLDNLDITVAGRIFRLCDELKPELTSCIIDLTHAGRIFFSGLALLRVLHGRLVDNGATVVYLADWPEVRGWIPVIVNGRSITEPIPSLISGKAGKISAAPIPKPHGEGPTPRQPNAIGL